MGLLGEQRNSRSASPSAAKSASSATLKSGRSGTAAKGAPAASALTRYIPYEGESETTFRCGRTNARTSSSISSSEPLAMIRFGRARP